MKEVHLFAEDYIEGLEEEFELAGLGDKVETFFFEAADYGYMRLPKDLSDEEIARCTATLQAQIYREYVQEALVFLRELRPSDYERIIVWCGSKIPYSLAILVMIAHYVDGDLYIIDRIDHPELTHDNGSWSVLDPKEIVEHKVYEKYKLLDSGARKHLENVWNRLLAHDTLPKKTIPGKDFHFLPHFYYRMQALEQLKNLYERGKGFVRERRVWGEIMGHEDFCSCITSPTACYTVVDLAEDGLVDLQNDGPWPGEEVPIVFDEPHLVQGIDLCGKNLVSCKINERGLKALEEYRRLMQST